MRCVDTGNQPETWLELYEELEKLPEQFRLPVVLFYLEGLNYEQASRQLGCPVRTFQSRLVPARARLRSRLARRGVAPAGTLLGMALVPKAVSGAVSEAWKQFTFEGGSPLCSEQGFGHAGAGDSRCTCRRSTESHDLEST